MLFEVGSEGQLVTAVPPSVEKDSEHEGEMVVISKSRLELCLSLGSSVEEEVKFMQGLRLLR